MAKKSEFSTNEEFWDSISKVWNWDKNREVGNDDGSNEPWKQFTRCSGKKIWLNCEEKDYHVYDISCTIYTYGSRCGFCHPTGKNLKLHPRDSFAQYHIDNTDENFLDKYWDYELNKDIDPWRITPNANKTFVHIKCQDVDYHIYKISCNKFTQGRRCGFCNSFASHKVHKLDSMGSIYPKSLELWSDKNSKTPYEYAPRGEIKVWWKCENGVHDDYKRDAKHSARFDFRCPECQREFSESVIQRKVREYINTLGYTIKHECDCTIAPINPKTQAEMPFDNEIVELRLIIEVHGMQHYELLREGFEWLKGLSPKEYLYNRRLYDRYKRIISKIYGYEYLEIPYWSDDENELWKNMIDNKIKEIII